MAEIHDFETKKSVTRLQLCGVSGCCPVVEIHHDSDIVIITDDDGGKVTLTKEQWRGAIARVKVDV